MNDLIDWVNNYLEKEEEEQKRGTTEEEKQQRVRNELIGRKRRETADRSRNTWRRKMLC